MADRYWLLTWTTYGTWLPGDPRGFVSNVIDADGERTRHNVPGTPPEADNPALHRWMREHTVGGPVWLTHPQAVAVLRQLLDTATYRRWKLLAVAVMANHTHVVVGVPGDPEPDTLLRDLKSYSSRALTKLSGRPVSGTWWTESGSRRKLPHPNAVASAVRYVADQAQPLVVWMADGEQGL